MRIKWTVDGKEFDPKGFEQILKKQIIEKTVEVLGERISKNIGKCSDHPDHSIMVEIEYPVSEVDSGILRGQISIKDVCCEKLSNKIEELKVDNNLIKD